MSRCKACDNIMTELEMIKKDPLSREYSELCTVCLTDSDEAIFSWEENGSNLYLEEDEDDFIN